jgi:hypothetical protein
MAQVYSGFESQGKPGAGGSSQFPGSPSEHSSANVVGLLAAAGERSEQAAAMLDTKCQNVPRGASEDKFPRPRWGPKHFRARGNLRDFMLVMDRFEYIQFFLTLTSAKGPGAGTAEELRADFQALRKRLARKFGIDPGEITYRGVDTSEGNGVLHVLIAVPPGHGRSARFLVAVEWIRQAWHEIHGARQFRIVPVRRGPKSIRHLSRYIVSQYIGGQDALIRQSGSRLAGKLPELRRAFLRLVMSNVLRYVGLGVQLQGCISWEEKEEAGLRARREWWKCFRVGWESILSSGHAVVFGQVVVVNLWGGLEYL